MFVKWWNTKSSFIKSGGKRQKKEEWGKGNINPIILKETNMNEN